MKSEKAKQRLYESFTFNSNIGIDRKAAIEAVDLAEQEAEERMREELTRWHDPKEELPEYAEVVEVKYKAFGKIMMAVAWRLGCSDSGEDVCILMAHLSVLIPKP